MVPRHPCAILPWPGMVPQPLPNHWDTKLCRMGPFQWRRDGGTAQLGQTGTTPAPSSLSGRFHTPTPPNGLCFVSLRSNKMRRQKNPPTNPPPLPGALRFVVPTPQNNRPWQQLQNSPCPAHLPTLPTPFDGTTVPKSPRVSPVPTAPPQLLPRLGEESDTTKWWSLDGGISKEKAGKDPGRPFLRENTAMIAGRRANPGQSCFPAAAPLLSGRRCWED